jgi:hypothetical protein
LIFNFQPLTSWAQQSRLKVIDATGAVGAVSVMVKGSNTGTTTDVNGNYQVRLCENFKYALFPSVGLVAIVEFNRQQEPLPSYIPYKTKKMND